MFIIIVFSLEKFRPSGLFFSLMRAVLLSRLASLFLPSSSVTIAILIGTCFFPTFQLQVHNVYLERKLEIVTHY